MHVCRIGQTNEIQKVSFFPIMALPYGVLNNNGPCVMLQWFNPSIYAFSFGPRFYRHWIVDKQPNMSLGVPTFKKISSDLAGWWIFRTIFHEDFKMWILSSLDTPVWRTTSAHAANVLALLQAKWAELACRWGVSYVDKIYIFEILMKNCSKYSSPSQIG